MEEFTHDVHGNDNIIQNNIIQRKKQKSPSKQKSIKSTVTTFVVGEGRLLQHSVHPAELPKEEARVVLEVEPNGGPGLHQNVDQIVHILTFKNQNYISL